MESHQPPRRLNYKFGKKDERDFKYKSIQKLEGLKETLPSCVDLRPKCPPIENQGTEGSCSAHASAGAVEFIELMEMRKHTDGPQLYDHLHFERVSRNFIYYNTRKLEGSVDSDAGATTLRSACEVLTNDGVCKETLWPYDPANMFKEPSPAAYTDALGHRIASYFALDYGYQLKHCIWAGHPFMFGFQVYESFMADDVAKTGIMSMPGPSEQVIGGHAVLCVGYDDAKQAFCVRNSWGGNWGVDGYFWMPYSYMSAFADDFYTLRQAHVKL